MNTAVQEKPPDPHKGTAADIVRHRELASMVFRELGAPVSFRERSMVMKAISYGYFEGLRDWTAECK